MAKELKVTTINFKSLDQDIDDPILAGAGDANGRTLRLIFTQEAEAQFTPETKVYLKWFHQQRKIKGLNCFTQIQKNDPPIWEIHWPSTMLYEGDVLCNIEVVDDVSIAPSVNFLVHVLSDPNDGSSFVVSDDYSIFQQAVIDLSTATEKAKEQLLQQKEEFDKMKLSFSTIEKKADKALDMAQKALDSINDSGMSTASTVTITDF